MKLGLRVQIILLLGSLMLLAFGPLFHAVATYSRYTLFSIRQDHAGEVALGIATRLGTGAPRSADALKGALARESAARPVLAVALLDKSGKVVVARGVPAAVSAVADSSFPVPSEVYELHLSGQRAVAIRVATPEGSVVSVLEMSDHGVRAARLLRLLALYTVVVACALLLAAYFALTRLIVRPLGTIVASAERVAHGGRHFEVPAGGAAELAALAGSVRSMTERLLREEQSLRAKVDEVERATIQLSRAQEGLIRSERLASVGRLAAGLAHEVGNPISALLGLQDLLLEGGLSEAEQRDFVERMKRETERINRILRDLLQFARAVPSSEAMAAPGSVAQAIEETAALLRPQKVLQEIELEVEVESDLPAVTLSGERLVQVLLNLLLNAADACAGGGVIRVRAAACADLGWGGVELSVSDGGCGIPSEVQAHLFEPFVTSKEVGKGSGLGLAVCRGLVEAVGGSIAFDEAHHPGARFVVRLPAHSTLRDTAECQPSEAS